MEKRSRQTAARPIIFGIALAAAGLSTSIAHRTALEQSRSAAAPPAAQVDDGIVRGAPAARRGHARRDAPRRSGSD